MTGALDLTAKQRLHLGAHNLLAGAGLLRGQRPVAVRADGDAFVVTVDGREVRVPSALRWRMYRRGWARRLSRLAHQFCAGDPVRLGPGDLVIDIGANVGEFGLACAAMGADVRCIEADPRVFACLTANTAETPRIACHKALLWKEPAELTFYSEPSHADSSIFADPKDGRYTQIKLPAIPLDDLAAAEGWGDIALLKCDAEGAEPEVLAGAGAVLARTRFVAIDTGPERLGQETHGPVAEALRAAGFTVSHDIRDKRKITIGRR